MLPLAACVMRALTVRRISGSIDRVTGDVEARTQTTPDMILRYALKCRPAQRMF
jgi:hypothetical protein